MTSNTNTAKPDLVHSFLHQVPGRVSAILENWHQLVHSDWDGKLLDTLVERISALAESGSKFSVPQITQSGNSLIGHLSDYHDTGLKPQHDDVVALDGLVHAFKDAAIQACNQQVEALANKPQEPASESPRHSGEHRVFLLGIDEAMATGLTRNLQARHFDVAYLNDAEQIIHHYEINKGEPSFLISHTDMLSKLFPESKKGGLWNSHGLPGLPVAFIADSSDLKTRLSAMRVDASAYWTKPVDPYLVAKRVHELSSSDTHTAYRVLIVEDDPAQADFADAILSKANFKCRSVTDPLQVMDALRGFNPDLILMDLYMPGASGTELTTVIREQNEFVDIPIVFLSGEQDLDKQLTALSFGGEDFLSKPIAPKHLITTVTNRIRRARQLTHRSHAHTRGEKEIGLHARNYLLERLDALLLAESPIDEVTGVFYLQIDNPETLIESVGIGGLDAVLAAVAKHLMERLQSQDILTRFGDNSLGLLALRPKQEALQILGDQLCQSISQQIIEVDSTTIGVTLSIGIYPVESGNQDSRSIIAHAQIASRQAQESGGNQVKFVEPQKQAQADGESAADMGSLVQKALDEDYFEIFFQPVVALQGSSQAHYQTLLRLQEPDGNLHLAADFIPAAEEMGLIGKVDQWMTRRAINVINEHKKQDNHLHLFVSQSTDLLENMERLTWLGEKHRSGHIGNDVLTFEFNINEVARSLNSAKICFDILSKIGINCLLTRVTHSAESERVIRHLPISYIKLDYSLLSEPQEGLKQLIELSHQLDIKVIAPQVEDPRSIAILWSSGADYVQGNFVQRPESNLIYDFNESVL
ncbi:MAG: EAL domain-containing protein [Candidatus Thiodiazotropha sp. (ex Dulcina madagascariensis)]|nr:EAL domain-containing protein [Candidatus Thiodiazotropha sp. (ex Dulcina madagascariensis)]MCU7926365.1 EAL domain-containing protein [Candidatus Thiodiazotropha sp. (ex Dulcina madagascariensis)]